MRREGPGDEFKGEESAKVRKRETDGGDQGYLIFLFVFSNFRAFVIRFHHQYKVGSGWRTLRMSGSNASMSANSRRKTVSAAPKPTMPTTAEVPSA